MGQLQKVKTKLFFREALSITHPTYGILLTSFALTAKVEVDASNDGGDATFL